MHNRLALRLVLGLPITAAACGGDGVAPPPETGDTIPPTIESLSPAPNDTGVALAAVIRVTFSESVNPATIATASFYVRQRLTADVILLAFSYEGRTVTATPVRPFDSLTSYRSTMTMAVRDSAGNQLPADTTWEFRTRGSLPAGPGAPLRTRS